MLADRSPPIALVVEDEWLLREDLVSEAKSRGWLVLEAASAESAIDLFATTHIDVLFTDIRLGGKLSGWDVAETLRANLPDLAVAYTSANPPNKARQVSNGVFFSKPYDAVHVVDAGQRLIAPWH